MNTPQIGFLHPGAMGISLAVTAKNGGFKVCWASSGRSAATRERAEYHGLIDLENMAGLVEHCQVLVSICPPHAAEDVAEQAARLGFTGLYIDANAIAPHKAGRIAGAVNEAGADFVDGGVIGGPAWEPGRTWLYLSGPLAGEAAAYFKAGPLETQVVSDRPGDASSLKMCFAAYTKGTTALLSAIMGAAEALGVRRSLEEQWSRGGSDFAIQTQNRVCRATAKAWRFEGEMREIAETFVSVGMPGGFHKAAAEIYSRTAQFKDAATPELPAVLAALQGRDPGRTTV